jgi:transposase
VLHDRTIDEATEICVGGEEIRLLPTPGNLKDCISVYLPRTKILFAGDTIYSSYSPTTRFGNERLWREWIQSLERLKEFEIEVIVPTPNKSNDCALQDSGKPLLEVRGRIAPLSPKPYQSEGMAALHPKPKTGRPSKATEAYKQQLLEAVKSDPPKLGKSLSNWSTSKLAQHLASETGISLHTTTVMRLSHASGWRFRRPVRVVASDPRYKAKRRYS